MRCCRPIDCQQRRIAHAHPKRIGPCRLVIFIMEATGACQVSVLPEVLRDALQKLHDRGTARHAPGVPPWSAEMDAWVLLRHVRDSVALAQLAKEGRAMDDGRTAEGIKIRWKRHLKDLPGIDTLRNTKVAKSSSAIAAAAEASTLPSWIYDQLAARHADKQPTKSAKAWSFDEDHQILECHLAGNLAELELTGRNAKDISREYRRLRSGLRFIRCPFPLALTNPEAPYQYLHYDKWSRIDPNRALPPDAHIDWQLGVAKVPKEWELWLDSSRFCFFDKNDDAPIDVNTREVFVLEDVSDDITVATITQRITAWMKKQRGPLADAVDHTRVHLAILDDGQRLAELEAITTPAGEGAGSDDHYYSAGERVYYCCRDGVPRSAMVIALDKRRKPDIYTIAVDYGAARASSDELFTSYPPPRFPPRPSRPLNVPEPEFSMGSRVWYDGPQVSAPRQARVVNVMSQRSTRCVHYNIILEGDEHNSTAALLSPVPIDTPLHEPPWKRAEIEEILKPEDTVRQADLFNRFARIIVVTEEVTDPTHGYWDVWRILQDTAPCPRSSSSDGESEGMDE